MSHLLGDYTDQKISSFDIDLELDPYKNRKHWTEVKAATGESKRFEKTKSELEKGYEKTYQFKDPTQTKLDIGSKVSETALRNLPPIPVFNSNSSKIAAILSPSNL